MAVGIAITAVALVSFPASRRSIVAAARALADPALVERPAPAAPIASNMPPRLQLWPEVGDEELDLAVAAEFSGVHGADLDGLGSVVLEIAPRRLRVPITRRTVRYVRFFTESPLGRAAMAGRLERFGRYREILEGELRSVGVLDELCAVAAMESGFDPLATSPAGAVGIWQLMPATARAYGLKIEPGLDQRRSLRGATRAAGTHLRDLYDHFGSWDLALAAYNAGTGRIERAMERWLEARPAGTAPPTFADLAQARMIPLETADYVPKVTAFSIVAENRKLFGLLDDEPVVPITTDELTVPAGTTLSSVAHAAESTVAELRLLNPELLGDRTPVDLGDQVVLLPAGTSAHAEVTLAALLRDNKASGDDAEAIATGFAPLPAVASLPLSNSRRAFGLLGASPGAFAMDDAAGPRPTWLGPPRLAVVDLAAGMPGFDTLDAAIAQSLGVAPRHSNVRVNAALQLLDAARKDLRSAHRTVGRDPLAGIDLERAGSSGERRARDFGQGAPGRTFEEVARAILAPDRLADAGAGPLGSDQAASPPPLPPLQHFTVGDIAVELQRVPERATTRFELRALATSDAGVLRETGSNQVVETLPSELDIVASLLRGKLRLMLAERSASVAIALRRATAADRRNELAQRADGPAWLALSDLLFPAGHPLEGTLLGARHDPDEALEAALLDRDRSEPSAIALRLRVEGDVDPAQLRAVLARATLGLQTLGLPTLTSGSLSVVPRVDGDARRTDLVLERGDPKVLFGFVAPAEATPSDAATRVALEILGGKKGRLRATLVDQREIATEVAVRLELGRRASGATIEIKPSGPIALRAVEDALRDELRRLAETDPDRREVAYAVGVLRTRVDDERKAADKPAPGARDGWSTTSARIRRALDPERNERALAALARVDARAVRDAMSRLLDAGPVTVTVRRRADVHGGGGMGPSARVK